jgi:lipopolysaccharide biosynthesis regulator YciM
MAIDLDWILLGLPLAFALGWLASRLDFRQLRIENRQAPKAYFKGLNHLLNEQQDQAIDAFIEAVQSDPDTSELHFALGNLFRRRGEYERAVRVHEHLLSRGDLSQRERDRAQHALALDFLKAGLLDHAETALRRLDGTELQHQGRLVLLSVYERTRDWPNASHTAHMLADGGQGDFSARQAHYLCEQALVLAPPEALRLLRQALATAPGAVRPGLEIATLQLSQGDADAAFQTLVEWAAQCPFAMPLAAPLLRQAAQQCGRVAEACAILETSYGQTRSLDVLNALVALDNASGNTQARYLGHLEQEPSLCAAAKLVQGQSLGDARFDVQLRRALEHASKPLLRYRCAACAFESAQHFWQCPACQAWDSFPPRRIEEL